ncbi:hypothetical protein PGAL8A_00329700 [Plasmodium gallinaceum]|uniref:Fam-j protein n=1 Tax=Plasmodium gallinaceum TaxID=5849 RepID=A0A1J1GUV5_PLAGA|nr:hypothetical protein PGAL8A_00329700 [Plasmodium gallinaceum]CRG96084.1 hypothetical protein PGAL8A_00329700 [Plasmodium gallinaceum]
MLYINCFYYIIQFFILINICISQEEQRDGKTNSSIKKKSSIKKSKIDNPTLEEIVNKENSGDDKLLPHQNVFSEAQIKPSTSYGDANSPLEQTHSTIQTKDIISEKGNIEHTENFEKNGKFKLYSVLSELQETLIHLQKELHHSPGEGECSTVLHEGISSEIKSIFQMENLDENEVIMFQDIFFELQSTLLHLQKQLNDHLLERAFLNVCEKSSSNGMSISSENSEQNILNLKNFFGEMENIASNLQIKPYSLPLESHENMPSNMGELMETTYEDDDELVELQNILRELENTPPYLVKEAHNSPFEQQCSTINDEEIPPNIDDIIFAEHSGQGELLNVENFLCELSNTPIDFQEGSLSSSTEEQLSDNSSENSPTTSPMQTEDVEKDNITDAQDFHSLLTKKEETCDPPGNSLHMKLRKRKYEGEEDKEDKEDKLKKQKTDNTEDDNKEKNIDNDPNTSKCNVSNSNDEMNHPENYSKFLQYIMENVFETKLTHLYDGVAPNLQNIYDNLKSRNNKLIKIINENIHSLKESIIKEMKNVNKADIDEMNRHCAKFSANANNSGENVDIFILSFGKRIKCNFNNLKKVSNNVKLLLNNIKDFKLKIYILKEISEMALKIAKNLTHNFIYLVPQILPEKNSEALCKILDDIENIIVENEKSIKNGFLLTDITKIKSVQQNIILSRNKLFPYYVKYSQKYMHLLNSLDISRKSNSTSLQIMLYFLNLENAKNRKNLEALQAYSDESAIKNIELFLQDEEKYITESQNKACKSFNLGFSERRTNILYLNKLINDKKNIGIIPDIYETLVELLRIEYFRKLLNITRDIIMAIMHINSKKSKKSSQNKSRKILTQEMQSTLLSKLNDEKQKLQEVKLIIKNLYKFDNLKKSIENFNKSLITTHKKTEGIITILESVNRLLCNNQNKEREDKKLVKIENILFALFFASKKIERFP